MQAAQPPLSEADIPQLLQLLHGALSPDASVQKQAEALLASLESRTGYCSCLAAVVGNPAADHSARWLAAVQLKNNVNKFWRPRYGSSGLSGEEKAYLRGRLLQLIPQDDSQIAVQVALVIAKAARFDFPAQWPTLFSDLLAGIAAAPAPGGAAHTAAAAAAAAAAAGSGASGSGGGPSQLAVRRTYLVLHHVLKELSSKRLAADQRAFAEVTQLLFDHVWGSWCGLLNDTLAGLPAALAGGQGPQPPAALLQAFERWLLLLKILRRLLLFGFQSDAKSLQPVPAVALVAPQLLAAVVALQQALSAGATAAASSDGSSSGGAVAAAGAGRLSAMIERGMLKLLKTLSQVQQEHPWSFHHAGVLLSSMDLCFCQLLAGAGAAPHPAARETLLLTCCCFLLGVLRCDGYAGRTGSGGSSSGPAAQQAATIKQMAADVSGQLAAWWAAPATLPALPAAAAAIAAARGSNASQQQQHSSRQAVLLQVLVAGYLPLSQRDLQDWLHDGEAWAAAHADTACSSDGLRPAARQLALALLLANKEQLTPVLVELLTGVSALLPPGQQAQGQQGHGVLLLKEAVYEAVALAAYDLHGAIDYPGWLRGSLLPEMMALQQPQPQQQPQLPPVLPRAAARLVGAWVADLRAEDRPAVYAALAVLLVQPGRVQQQQQQGGSGNGGDPDVVLQLAAVAALRVLVDDFGFEGGQLCPVLPAVMEALTGMLRCSEELDTQTQVFGLLNVVIERLGPDFAPHVGGLLQLLPQIWQDAEDQSLLRIQVLCCLSLLLNVLGPEAAAAYPLALPLLQHALHPGCRQPELLEDALALWLVALRNAPGHPGSGDAGPAAPLLELAPALAACLCASTEHIALGMQLLASLLLLGGPPFLASHGPQLAAALTGHVGEVVERGMLLLLPPMDLLLVAAPQQAAPLLLPALQKLLGLVLSGRESGVVVANSLAVFGRLLLRNPAAFEQLLGNAAAAGVTAADGGGGGAEGLLLALVGVWTDAFDSIAQPLARKLGACGLAALLGLPVKSLLHQLPLLLPPIASVWHELEASGADDPGSERGDLLYGSSIWSAGHAGSSSCWGGSDGLGHDDVLAGQILVASEEAAGEAARRDALRQAEPLRQLRISSLLADKLSAAAALHGPDFNAAMAALDPAVAQQVQAVLAAAAAGIAQQQQQQQ